MGKADKSRKKDVKKKNGRLTTSRPPNAAEKAANNALRESKVLPVVKNLSSTSPKERAEAVSAINNLLQDATCRQLLLRERVVQKLMEEMLNDSSQEVIVYAWGALRNISVDEGYDQSIFMYRKNILAPVASALQKISSTLTSLRTNPGSLSSTEKKILWLYTENVIGLIASLSETSEDVAEAIVNLDILPLLMEILNEPSEKLESLHETIAQCLYALTEESDDFVEAIVSNGDYVSLLLKLRDQSTPSLKSLYTCASLHNISLALKGTDVATDHEISDLNIVSILTDFLRSTPNPPPTDDDQKSLIFKQLDLEILASIATEATDGPSDGAAGADADGDIDLMNEGADGDDDEKDIPLAAAPDELDESVRADMEMVVGDESNQDSTDSTEGTVIHYLITTTGPVLLSLIKSSSGSSSSLRIHIRALSVLNNIAWTVDATLTEGDSALWQRWQKLSHDIWHTCVTPVLAANTADVELAEAVTGLAWAISKSVKGGFDVSQGEHRAFVSLYHAANTDELRTKCVGVLGCLGLAQGRVGVNQEIGVFLMTLVAAGASTPTNPLVEALNAIFDIYADAEFDYDEPVFVKNAFLGHLSKAISGVRSAIKKIDKNKFPEDRLRADDALLNLQRFIKYKKKERES
ncbi:ARM repeat-containing protein [Choiromyces venosus 120613-1]|uniref:ARM repeat-containing protein n=1 Tax=Choiromyces venosus 120613-1 TaxID=1336337 RepID=A0A3N4K412_9PEZI|nr:ARM repeat-containing protein [Choiromyces venosus 120613-1]